MKVNMSYILKVDPNEINNIKKILNVTWKSKVIPGLIFVESNYTIDNILKIKGVISCREEEVGSLIEEIGSLINNKC